MKSKALRLASIALILAAVSGQAVAGRGWGGHGYHGGYHGHGYSHHGGDGWVIGGALALLAAGTYVALNSEPTYAAPTVVYDAPYYGAPVYAAPPVYAPPVYAAPVYAAPPVEYAAPVARNDYAGGSDVIAYPNKGQSNKQQARDRSECHGWAMNQSGFDPAHVTQWTTPVMADSYSRAIGACMTGRGYTLN